MEKCIFRFENRNRKNILKTLNMGLNLSKGNMYSWLTHTFNTIKGECEHLCSYCHPKGTLIMMSDFTQKSIEKINIGDEIIGINKNNGIGFYKFTKTKVIDLSRRTSKTIEFNTENGSLICTPEHPLMGSTEKRNCSDWKSAKSFTPYENLRYITSQQRGYYSNELRYGYLKGVIDGDGCIFNHYNKEGKKYLGFEIVCVDEQLRSKIKNEFKIFLGIPLLEGIKRANKNSYGNDCIMLHTRKSKNVQSIIDKTSFRINKEFAKGYIAGMIDTDGSVGKKGVIRISQSYTVNRLKYDQIVECCELLGLRYVKETNCIRINSDFKTKIDILFNYGIFHSLKSERLIIGNTIKGSYHSQIKSITALGEMDVYNLQTECENFIANGFIVHNCYMNQWGKQNPVRFDKNELKTDLGNGNYIFVGSSCDMFSESIKPEWIIKTLQHCEKYKNAYLFQSKNPKAFNVYGPNIAILDKFALCTTIETNRWYDEVMNNCPTPQERSNEFSIIPIDNKLVTIEPIMNFDLKELLKLIYDIKPKQVNIGANTSVKVSLPEPPKEKIIELISDLERFTKVKKKSNLNRLLK